MLDMNNRIITDKELESMSGGYVHADSDNNCYEIIDDKTGEILACGCETLRGAHKKARKLGQSTYEITDDFLETLREEYIA